MGKFEDSIPKYIAQLENQLIDINAKRMGINWGHDCDCEFCDQRGEDADPDAEKIAQQIDDESRQVRLTIERLQRHAALFKKGILAKEGV